MYTSNGRNASEGGTHKKNILCTYFILKLYSRIIINKINLEEKKLFRVLENKFNILTKIQADIDFLK